MLVHCAWPVGWPRSSLHGNRKSHHERRSRRQGCDTCSGDSQWPSASRPITTHAPLSVSQSDSQTVRQSVSGPPQAGPLLLSGQQQLWRVNSDYHGPEEVATSALPGLSSLPHFYQWG